MIWVDRGALMRAEQAASLAGLGRAAYDALLETMFEHEDKRQISTRHREHLVSVLDEYGSSANKLDVDALQEDIGDLSPKLRTVLLATKNWIASGANDPGTLFGPYAAAEARKCAHARLARIPNGRSRRLEGPLHYSASASPNAWTRPLHCPARSTA
jgi:hypothetical protein